VVLERRPNTAHRPCDIAIVKLEHMTGLMGQRRPAEGGVRLHQGRLNIAIGEKRKRSGEKCLLLPAWPLRCSKAQGARTSRPESGGARAAAAALRVQMQIRGWIKEDLRLESTKSKGGSRKTGQELRLDYTAAGGARSTRRRRTQSVARTGVERGGTRSQRSLIELGRQAGWAERRTQSSRYEEPKIRHNTQGTCR
jgi:hypothetical protein